MLPGDVVYEGRFQEEKSQAIVITIKNKRVVVPRRDMLSFGISRSGLDEGVYKNNVPVDIMTV